MKEYDDFSVNYDGYDYLIFILIEDNIYFYKTDWEMHELTRTLCFQISNSNFLIIKNVFTYHNLWRVNQMVVINSEKWIWRNENSYNRR